MALAVSGLLMFVGRDGNRSHKLSILLKSPVAKAPGFLFVRKISKTKVPYSIFIQLIIFVC